MSTLPLWLAVLLTALSLPVALVLFALVMSWIDPWYRG